MEALKFVAYCIYLVFVFGLTLIVAQQLFKNSINFMQVIFKEKTHLAYSTNHLFKIGFFLLAFGVGIWYLQSHKTIANNSELLEMLSVKLGGFTLFLGGLLFFNMYLFFRGMKASKKNTSIENTLK